MRRALVIALLGGAAILANTKIDSQFINIPQLMGFGLITIGNTLAVNTAVVTSVARDESGGNRYCKSSNGSTSCTCSLLQALQVYTEGMTLNLNADHVCSTLSVDSVGAVNVLNADGTANTSQLPGSARWIWFDGAAFRVE